MWFTTQVKRTEWQVCAADPDSGMGPREFVGLIDTDVIDVRSRSEDISRCFTCWCLVLLQLQSVDHVGIFRAQGEVSLMLESGEIKVPLPLLFISFQVLMLSGRISPRS